MDWWLTDSEGIVASWLLIFAACNALRGAYCRFRDRDARRTVQRLIAGQLHPVRASFLLGGMAEAAETAVCMLVDDGVVKTSYGGELRPTRRGREQTDPALRALVEEIHRTPANTTTKLYEIVDQARFTRFRQLVEVRSPKVRMTASGKSQTLMLATTIVTSIGMGINAGMAEAPVPFFPDADRTVWLYVCMGAWAVQWGPACLWPSEKRRRWKALDAFCRDKTDRARAALSEDTRQAIARAKERPKPPPPPYRPPTRSRSQSGSGSWADSVDVDSCSSCGGCGGD
ncbi:hypothetical protein G6045_09705 [Streptomyces sp. YC504]|uniref:TIGR04222 domain-containing membrane protein n=1 Tax=Streptomyces mesophilus TaxID=1775132 RepID=A0A6G4XEI1_9ACTN|nr:hypothetical protein [Streptomyces mesophilus]NGO75945.1 hypothetical protein [Streptomyces mesophilus]